MEHCLWKVIGLDYNVRRYNRYDKRSKLPGWILSHLREAHLNLSTDMALHIAREILRPKVHPPSIQVCSNGIWGTELGDLSKLQSASMNLLKIGSHCFHSSPQIFLRTVRFSEPWWCKL
ncbi:hypothetical protein O6H91_14G055600 [Diphasiastrum complanatum]|uniref:Uncharacterized protein n=1 Tax=Diphasiastrum complanatum TaxID=34168 RepID=A0ACC2BPP1_DIPCM|nr:hypothetical protein O6H91_14G055600 [Diphasiastrum complanatum]